MTRAEEDEGAEEAGGADGAEVAEVAEGGDRTDVVAIYIYIYIVRWLGHHGNRLYDFMGLQSKMSEWSEKNLQRS